MAIDLTVSRPTMYCTWLDVISLLVTQAQTSEANFSAQEIFNRTRSIAQIENLIVQATALVRSELAKYGLTMTGTPWATTPTERGTEKGSRANIGDGRLIAVEVASTCDVCAVWKVKITTAGNKSAAKYQLYSYVEGAQGTNLVMTSDQSSTNVDITVGSNSFDFVSKNWEVGDSYFFSAILATSEIWTVVTTLTAGLLMNALYTEEAPNESRYGAILFNRAMGWIKSVHEGRAIPIGGSIDYSPIQMPYNITEYGEDNTEYATDDTENYND